jgi:hypothetical protein
MHWLIPPRIKALDSLTFLRVGRRIQESKQLTKE